MLFANNSAYLEFLDWFLDINYSNFQRKFFSIYEEKFLES